ncbi:pilus assembly protein [Streptomyces sp. HB2AG]|nr:TadE family type IV pilus minor pilin [Streptomyces sp. HB2AG]MCZ2524578.1 pilus assembly protein [Streptomyces sp. HB2AG]
MRDSERPRPAWRGDAGQATAETAVVLPVLALALVAMLWGVTAAVAQIRCVDAARAGARAAARDEPESTAVAAARSAAPPGAQVSVGRGGDEVRVEVSARSLGPGRLAGLLSVTVRAEAVALAEDSVGGDPSPPAAGVPADAPAGIRPQGAAAGEER